MEFGSISNLADLLGRFQTRRGGNGDIFERLAEARAEREERRAERQERRAERRESRRSERNESSQPEETAPQEEDPVASVPGAPDEAAPVEEEAPVAEGSPVSADSVDGLARLYVAQFEEGSGRDLSEEEFEAKVKNVSDFYSQLSNGQSRLDAVVFANDGEDSVVA